MRPVVVYGATGHTGRLVARSLSALGHPLVLAGRRHAALTAMADTLPCVEDVRVCDVDDAAGLRKALDGAGAVVSTVGPFLSLGLAVAAAAVDDKVPYVDTSAEQPFVRRVVEGLDAIAARRGTVLLPGHGADWAFQLLGAAVLRREVGRLREVHAFHDLGTFSPSPGTVRSMIGMLGQPVVGFSQGQWRPAVRTWGGVPVTLPDGVRASVPFPGGDVVLLPRDEVTLRACSSNLLLSAAEARGVGVAMSLLPSVRRFLPEPVLDSLARRVADRVPEPSAPARWTVWVRAVGEDGSAWCRVEGPDTYENTGDVAGLLAVHLARGEGRAHGVRTAGRALDAVAVLDGLRRFGVRWQVQSA